MSHFGHSSTQGNLGTNPSFDQVVDATVKQVTANGVSDTGLGVRLRRESAVDSDLGVAVQSTNSNIKGLIGNMVSSLYGDSRSETTPGLKINTESNRRRAEAAAVMAFHLGAATKDFAGNVITPTMSNDAVVMQASGRNPSLKPTLRAEAFNNINPQASQAFTVGAAAAAIRQTDVVMAWAPPILVNPNVSHLSITLDVRNVFDGAYHDPNGDPTVFRRENIARAFADGNVLSRHNTQMIPLYRTNTAHHFVDDTVLPPYNYIAGKRTETTSHIKFGERVNLMGLSSTEALLRTGPMGHRDMMEPGTKLEEISFKVGADVIRLKTLNIRTANFIGSQQGDNFDTLLNMRGKMALGKGLKAADGTALTGPLKVLADQDLRANVLISANGTINIEQSNAIVQKPTIELQRLYSVATGQDAPAAAFNALKAELDKAEMLGWFPRPYRTNANRRQWGDRLNGQRFTYAFPIPYRDPVTAERPAHSQQDQDAADLISLTGLCRVRIENELIDRIVQVEEQLTAQLDNRIEGDEKLDLEGLAQTYLLPTIDVRRIHLPNFIDSLKSHERPRDIQAVLAMQIRDMSSRLYTESQWKAATDISHGGTLPPPQVNLLTDPVLGRYLMEPGELRLAGDFEYVITTTLNYTIRNRIYMSFRIPGQENSNEPCIYNPFHLLTSPDLVLAANMTREGSYFAEQQVQPRYDIPLMCPVLGVLYVTGVKEVLSKVPGLVKLSDPVRLDSAVVPPKPPVGP